MVANLLLVDNFDSFTRNLEHLLIAATGLQVQVVSYAEVSRQTLLTSPFLVLSPGPGHPADYPLYRCLTQRTGPTLGICLGMQAMNLAFGGHVQPLADCIHGKTDVFHFQGAPRVVARYHSLWCSQVASSLVLEGANSQGVPMVLRHRTLPMLGYQFHPESFLTHEPHFWIHHVMETLA